MENTLSGKYKAMLCGGYSGQEHMFQNTLLFLQNNFPNISFYFGACLDKRFVDDDYYSKQVVFLGFNNKKIDYYNLVCELLKDRGKRGLSFPERFDGDVLNSNSYELEKLILNQNTNYENDIIFLKASSYTQRVFPCVSNIILFVEKFDYLPDGESTLKQLSLIADCLCSETITAYMKFGRVGGRA